MKYGTALESARSASPSSARYGRSRSLTAGMNRCSVLRVATPTVTRGTPSRSATRAPENSPTSCITTSGANAAHAARTPGSEARVSRPANTSVPMSRLRASSSSRRARAMTASRSAAGGSANANTSYPAARTASALDPRVATRTSAPRPRAASTNGIMGPK